MGFVSPLYLALQELRDPEKTVMPLVSGLCAQKTFNFAEHVLFVVQNPKVILS